MQLLAAWLQASTTLISSLAWPVTVLLIAFGFKHELIKLLARVSEASGAGFNFKFRDLLDHAEEAAAKFASAPPDFPPAPPMMAGAPVPLPQAGPHAAEPIIPYSVAPVVESDPIALRANPTGVVMESWKTLEQTLRAFGEANHVSVGPKYASGVLVSRLSAEGLISPAERETLTQLMELRNLAAHSSRKISETEAMRFRELTDNLARIYEVKARVLGAPPPPPPPPT
jgi:hypothetical protein